MNHNDYSGTIYAFISLGTWVLTITAQNIQVAVSIMGGLIAMISGIVSIYKNIKKK